ncbi:putative adenylyltransferase/sulfurtransferase MoeZ [Legionella massiliensis]|uniref:Putative adenylyltransferase/sulfurtransferase MoeZ n=1 Tax=Legionella massiliensis TaxID=1034943 RepID=A0A078KYN7_9GAMM|nr:rhodanese-like domain-containing protein [Legionella massiliensis]CDZ76884.1 putative adenylyltransferase/sulfurtransferase MoeZ [Legionella massiliensis]CEE12622.1 putative adenylyltransferase/sulfurtransferase MoeZ [Legionella massiliensis]
MTSPKIHTIDVHELKRRRDAEPTLCLIDVRELNEWQAMHIPGALHIPKDEIVGKIAKQIPEQDKPIYLHCQGGVRSLYAAEFLANMGYKEVYSINGGIAEWAKSGYPIEK